jgi:hypothetical protein
MRLAASAGQLFVVAGAHNNSACTDPAEPDADCEETRLDLLEHQGIATTIRQRRIFESYPASTFVVGARNGGRDVGLRHCHLL